MVKKEESIKVGEFIWGRLSPKPRIKTIQDENKDSIAKNLFE
jgi:hypothetical protein